METLILSFSEFVVGVCCIYTEAYKSMLMDTHYVCLWVNWVGPMKSITRACDYV